MTRYSPAGPEMVKSSNETDPVSGSTNFRVFPHRSGIVRSMGTSMDEFELFEWVKFDEFALEELHSHGVSVYVQGGDRTATMYTLFVCSSSTPVRFPNDGGGVRSRVTFNAGIREPFTAVEPTPTAAVVTALLLEVSLPLYDFASWRSQQLSRHCKPQQSGRYLCFVPSMCAVWLHFCMHVTACWGISDLKAHDWTAKGSVHASAMALQVSCVCVCECMSNICMMMHTHVCVVSAQETTYTYMCIPVLWRCRFPVCVFVSVCHIFV